MFLPANSQFSTEEFLELSTGSFVFSDATKIGLVGTTIRLLSQSINTGYTAGNWATPPWTNQNNLTPPSGSLESDFVLHTSVGFLNPMYANTTPMLSFETQNTSEYFHITETSSFNTADNTVGYTLETRVQVITTDTSSTKLGHGLLVDDTDKKIEFYFVDSGVGVRGTTDFIPVDLQTVPRTIRFGFKQDDYYVLLQNGQSFAGIDKLTISGGATKKIQLGAFNTSSDSASPQTIGKTLVDYIYQSASGLYLDENSILDNVYSTTEQTATTPEYAPLFGLNEYEAAYVVSEIATGNGTTSIKTQYKSSIDTNWTDYGSYINITSVPNQQLLLSTIPTVGDGSDKLRFQVKQVSTDGSAEPPRIDRISIKSSSDQNRLVLEPTWGTVDGGNTIAVKLEPSDALKREHVVKSDTLHLFHFNSGSYSTDSATGTTATFAGAVESGIAGQFNEAVQIGTSVAASATNATSLLDSFIDVTGYVDPNGNTGHAYAVGSIASGFDIVINSNNTVEYLPGNHTVNITPGTLTGESKSAQTVKAYSVDSADGFYISDLTSSTDGDKLLKFYLEIKHGGVQIVHDDGTLNNRHYLANMDYHSPKEVSLLVTGFTNTNTNKISFMSNHQIVTDYAEFSVSDIRVEDFSTGTISYSADSRYNFTGDFSTDFYTKPLAYHLSDEDTKLLVAGTTTVSLNNKGYLKVVLPSNTGISSKIVPLNKYSLIGVSRKTDVLNLSVDGEVCSTFIYSDDVNMSSTNLQLATGNHIAFDEFRFRDSAELPTEYAQSVGITSPKFKSVYQLPLYTGVGTTGDWRTLALMHFNEVEGPVVNEAETLTGVFTQGVIPHTRRDLTLRGESGVIGNAVRFVRKFNNYEGERYGGINLPYNTGISNSAGAARSVFFKAGGYTNPNKKSSIVSLLSGADGTNQYGFDIGINTSGYLYVDIYTGTTNVTSHINTSTYLGTNTFTPAMVGIDPANTSIYSMVGTSYASSQLGAEFSGYSQGAHRGLEIGYGVVGSVDELTVINGLLDTSTYNNWRELDMVKSNQELDIYVDGDKLSYDRVLPVHPNLAYVVMPEEIVGDKHFYVDFGSYKVSSHKPYKYTNSFNRTIMSSGIAAVACETKSPFRILDTVPDGSVNLALINTPDLSAENNVSFIDLSDKEVLNISNHLHGQFSLQDYVVTGNQIYYANQADTNDIVISNRSVVNRELDAPYPLFYKYLVGRGRYYFNRPGVEANNLDVIKSSINVTDEFGADIQQKNYPYDIEVSTVDYDNSVLPSGNFSIVLYTNKLFLPNKTVFVKYNASDSANQYKLIPGKTEVVNPVPIFKLGTGQDTYSGQINSSGVYDLYLNTG